MKTRRFMPALFAVLGAVLVAGLGHSSTAGRFAAHPVAASGPAQAQTPAATPAQRTYVVQRGDTLTAIARRFGVTVEQLVAANGIANPRLIHAGQMLVIPGPATPVPTRTAPATAPRTPSAPTSSPRGAEPTATRTRPGPGTVVQYAVQRGDTLTSIARRFDTTVEAILYYNRIDNPNLVFTGTVLTVFVGDKTSRVAPSPSPTPTAPPAPTAPQAPPATGGPGGGNSTNSTKWIDVNLSSQTLVAYEGDVPVYRTLVSTGVLRYPTVQGTFRIYAKLRYDDMSGGVGAEHYYLPNVPHVMYFTGSYAIHGTYWHNNFGHPMSHGCVNLSRTAAAWVFNWAAIGTSVYVHR